MKLTDGEKIIIALLAEVHEALEVKNGLDTKLLKAALYSGSLWSLKWEMTGLLGAEEPSEAEVKETSDILDMWRAIESSYSALDDAEKQRVQVANHGTDPKFPGFDANNERHYGIMEHMIEEMGRWDEFKDRYRNSHSPSVDYYIRMFEIFEPLRREMGRRSNYNLTADEIISILQ